MKATSPLLKQGSEGMFRQIYVVIAVKQYFLTEILNQNALLLLLLY